jgi:RNA polymerase sigma-70 factor (ECF subfamily)
MRQLEVALAGLRESTRAVFLLHHVERLTYPEIARRQGVTTRTVEREMARALTHCAGQLQPFLEEV